MLLAAMSPHPIIRVRSHRQCEDQLLGGLRPASQPFAEHWTILISPLAPDLLVVNALLDVIAPHWQLNNERLSQDND
jgi:hypothetical protein